MMEFIIGAAVFGIGVLIGAAINRVATIKE